MYGGWNYLSEHITIYNSHSHVLNILHQLGYFWLQVKNPHSFSLSGLGQGWSSKDNQSTHLIRCSPSSLHSTSSPAPSFTSCSLPPGSCPIWTASEFSSFLTSLQIELFLLDFSRKSKYRVLSIKQLWILSLTNFPEVYQVVLHEGHKTECVLRRLGGNQLQLLC